MSSKNHENVERDIIVDRTNRKTYLKGNFLGKGGFAKCYEIQDHKSNKLFAGKIVSKKLLQKPHQKEKMKEEVAIHRILNHKYIVGFNSFFEDDDNVYIVLELCRRKSLMEMQKRRKILTEPEARYFVHQIATACEYLHSNNIIHRDLKLGNLFLNDNMEVKVGDFGLASRVGSGERKKTLCGTPNYIAPEVLKKVGHSFEVDVWSLGCILYTFLIGRPPFETLNLKVTYARIKDNAYEIPPGMISESTKDLIKWMLQDNPVQRPTMKDILKDKFFTSGHHPQSLPTSCLSVMPRFPEENGELLHTPLAVKRMSMAIQEFYKPVGQANDPQANDNEQFVLEECYLSQLKNQLQGLIASEKFGSLPVDTDDAEDPAAVPIFWLSRWVDYSDKYGLGYQLCDDSVGVLFNDETRIILGSDKEMVQYIERDGTESFYTKNSYPEALNKKITLLKFFEGYMNENLVKAGGSMTPRENMTRLPFLLRWYRSNEAINLYLSNGTLQINFFKTHQKIILCPLMEAVTFIDANRCCRTFKFSLIREHGCSSVLASCLRYAVAVVKRLLIKK